MIECQRCLVENDDDANWCKTCKTRLWQNISSIPLSEFKDYVKGEVDIIPQDLKNSCKMAYLYSINSEDISEKIVWARCLLSLIRASTKISNEQESICQDIDDYIRFMGLEIDRFYSYTNVSYEYPAHRHIDALKTITENSIKYCKNLIDCGYG